MTTAAKLDALIEDLTVDAYDDEEQLPAFLVGAQEALVPGEPATILGVEVNVVTVDRGPDVRTGLTARVQRDGATYEVAPADLTLAPESARGLVVAAYRRWQGR